MIPYKEMIGKNLQETFPRTALDLVCIGDCRSWGLRLGFEGWTEGDIQLDPTMPLDAMVDVLGLNEAFETVECNYYLNAVHGDCTLTHVANGVKKLAKKGGRIVVKALDTIKLAEVAMAYIKGRQYIYGQILEKFLFRPPFDSSGLIYQQTMMDSNRLKAVMGLQFKDLKIAVESAEMVPDDIRLEGISDTAWALASEINEQSEGLTRDWPQCLCCRRLTTKMDADRRYFSRYCKDHYAEARNLCDKQIVENYSFVTEFKKF